MHPTTTLFQFDAAGAVPTRTVVVADDDEDMRLYLSGCLRALGFDVVLEASDGEAAFTLAHAASVALVVSDVRMPGLDGRALCHALKADVDTAGIPVLFVSGETRTPPPCADGFLRKPFNAAGLRAHVERLLPSSRR